MTNVQLTEETAYASQMAIHTSTVNTDIRLTREFQKHLSEPTRAHISLDHIKGRKRSSKQKWNESDYHVQDSKYVPHTSVKISCVTT